ncbi:response regulator transcription factor [Fulvivirgaceae bacterium PWU4]|uniref:Response regulator transcription factor n=1 Tax=Chryseosolibacter histidini TaxID=2782349 RepID=A0AAP2GMD9_9BACT|nr:response regulator transcription factor [Chryseosolibacter histidini]MBT1701154.1 response regulator transcription factor [Chryseosolibacter histidini]
MTKIILADDHQLFIEGVRTVLTEIPEVEITATVNNGSDLMEKFRSTTVDLVLLDLNMPKIDGLKCLQEIKKERPHVKVLVLTNYNQPELMEEVKQLKADGFMVKNSTATELRQAVERILAGEKLFSELQKPGVLDESSYFFDDFLKKFKLTRREVDIIRLVCREFSSKQIAAELHLSEFTVNTHRKNIQRKLNVKNVAGLVAFAKEHQLVR